VAGKYLVAHSRSPHYKALLKTLFKAALAPLPVQVLFRAQPGVCSDEVTLM